MRRVTVSVPDELAERVARLSEAEWRRLFGSVAVRIPTSAEKAAAFRDFDALPPSLPDDEAEAAFQALFRDDR